MPIPEPEFEPFDPPLADIPTQSRAGSRERIAVYRERYAAGFAVLHPSDNPRMIHPTQFNLPTRRDGLGPQAELKFIAVPAELVAMAD